MLSETDQGQLPDDEVPDQDEQDAPEPGAMPGGTPGQMPNGDENSESGEQGGWNEWVNLLEHREGGWLRQPPSPIVTGLGSASA